MINCVLSNRRNKVLSRRPMNILHTLWDVTILWSSDRWSALGSLCSLLRPPWDNSRPGKSFLSTALPWKFIVVVRIQSFFLKFISESLKIWLTDNIYYHLISISTISKVLVQIKRVSWSSYLNVRSNRSRNCFAALGSAEVRFNSAGWTLGRLGMGKFLPNKGFQSLVDVKDHLNLAGRSIGCIFPHMLPLKPKLLVINTSFTT